MSALGDQNGRAHDEFPARVCIRQRQTPTGASADKIRNHLAADWRGLDLSLALSLSLLPDLVILLLVYPPLLSSTFSFVSRPHLLLVSFCLVTFAFLLERYIPVGTGVRRCRPTALFQTTAHRLVSQLTTPSTVVWPRSLFSHVLLPGTTIHSRN